MTSSAGLTEPVARPFRPRENIRTGVWPYIKVGVKAKNVKPGLRNPPALVFWYRPYERLFRRDGAIESREVALDFVRDPFVWFSPPAKFNDPFEFNPRVKIAFKGAQLKELLEAHGVSVETSLREAEIILARKLHSEARAGYRVMCFTEDPLSLPMWAHYGGEHRGIVVGFDSDIIEPFKRLSHNVYGGPVRYEAKRPIVTIKDQDFHDETMEVIFTKSKAWEYEREWRIALLGLSFWRSIRVR